MSTVSVTESPFKAVEHRNLVVGNLAKPISPILHLSVLFDLANDRASGLGVVFNAATPPWSRFDTNRLHGSIHTSVFGPTVTRIVHLAGSGHFDNPDIPLELEFSATLEVDAEWKGRGSFRWGNREVKNVPVKPAP